MKSKTVCLAMTFAVVSSQAGFGLAGWGDGPGCGLGKMVFENEPKSILLQHLGSTLNVPSQPFAISTGVSGCTNNGLIVKEEQTTIFAGHNFENLLQEMAQGRGEHLAALATLLGVPPHRQPEFFALVQDRYHSVVQAGDASPKAMLAALRVSLPEHPGAALTLRP
jgi:DUF3015 family protein